VKTRQVSPINQKKKSSVCHFKLKAAAQVAKDEPTTFVAFLEDLGNHTKDRKFTIDAYKKGWHGSKRANNTTRQK